MTDRTKTKKAFRAWLNERYPVASLPYKNGVYRNQSRDYGDYLYAQDREMFDWEYANWLSGELK